MDDIDDGLEEHEDQILLCKDGRHVLAVVRKFSSLKMIDEPFDSKVV